MKVFIKNTVIVTLLTIFLFGACSSVIIPTVNAINQKDTPVANIANDTYQSYYDSDRYLDTLRNQVKSMGGTVYREDELNNNKVQTAALDYEYNFQPVQQVITVMTTATGSKENGNYVESKPLANAIVRINGVPRFTDKNGQVRVTLDREYVELFVEKNGYGPYIEIMEVTGGNKTVNLKKESDDIDIYGVMLTAIEYNPVNLINSEYTIFPDALGDYIANMKFLVNVNADRYMLLLDSKVIYSSAENVIYDIDFTNDMEGKKFYAQVEYQGIMSEPVELNLSISIPEFYKEIETYGEENTNALNPFAGNDKSGIFDNFTIDFSKLPQFKEYLGNMKLDLAVDMRKSTITINIGYTISDYKCLKNEEARLNAKEVNQRIVNHKANQQLAKNKKNKFQEDVNKANEEIEKAKQDINEFEDEIQTQKIIINNLESQKAEIQANNTQEINRINEMIDVAQSNINNLQNNIDDINKDVIAKEKTTIEECYNQIDAINAQQKKDFENIDTYIDQANTIKESMKKEEDEAIKKVEELNNKVRQSNMDISNIDALIKNIGNDIKDIRDLYSQEKKGIRIGFEFFGIIEYNFKYMSVSKFSVSLGLNFKFSIEGKFMAGYIPMFYVLSINGKFEASIEFYDYNKGFIDYKKIWEYLFMKLSIGFEVELGVGVNDLLSVSAFAGAKYSIMGYVGFKEFWTYFDEVAGSELELQVGIRLKALYVFSYELSDGKVYRNPNLSIDQIYEKYRNCSTLAISAMMCDDNILANNIYDGSKPQIEKVGDDYIASWIDMEFKGNEPRTVLKYSIYRDGTWSIPKAVYNDGSDFYHDMYFDGQDLHITWQKINEGTDITSLEETCKNSEIYYAKFNADKLEFDDIEKLTDNNSLDAGPRFVLQDSVDQPLAIVWQRNSMDDIFGMTGRNSIAYSKLDDGNWGEYRIIYESDNYFSFVDSAYVDGKLTSAFVEDMDNDLTTDDRKIFVISEGEQSRIIGKEFEVVNNPQFFKINGKTKLTFYADGNVRYTDDFINIDKLDVLDGKINDTYKIMENDTNIYVYYYKVSADNSHQAFASMYDKQTGDWQTDVCLTSAEDKVTCPSIAILPNGDILTVYNSLDRETEIVSLEYEIKQLRKDFEISYVFYNLDVMRGEKFDLNLIIKNTGDYPIKSLDISAFGITDTIVLDKAIEIGGTDTVKVERIFDISAEGKEIITVIFGDVVKRYALTTRFTDVSIDGTKKIDTYSEYYDLTLKNSSDEDSNVYLDVYYNGEIIDTIQMYLKGQSQLQFTYQNDELQNGGYIYFEIRTDKEDKYTSDNSVSFFIEHMAHKEEAKINPYFESLQIAKSL